MPQTVTFLDEKTMEVSKPNTEKFHFDKDLARLKELDVQLAVDQSQRNKVFERVISYPYFQTVAADVKVQLVTLKKEDVLGDVPSSAIVP